MEMTMRKLNLSQSIGESVTENPELVKVYMAYNVDFCCGGERSIQEALESDTDRIEEIIVEAEKAMEDQQSVGDKNIKLSDLSSEALIDQIINRHHKFLKKELPIISELMFKILNVHGENHPELFDIHLLFGQLKTELEGHLVKEEKLLFPELKKNSPNVKALIDTLETEHDNAGDALHGLTELTDHFKLPEDACPSFTLLYDKLKDFVADMYVHVHSENNVLFKRFV
jgi:regulator of cell morphogenesis and NO signaling